MKVSIIVPVYNVENYIKECIISLLKQDYPDFEVILINDGSEDQSGKICESYAAEDKRIQVIHQVNSGVSAARNAGLAVVTGDYITFIDADDWVEFNYVSSLVKSMQRGGMSVCKCLRENIKEPNNMTSSSDCIYMSREEAQKSVLSLYGIKGYVCGKLFDTELIRQYGICFNKEISILEDQLFTIQYLSKTYNPIAYVQKPLYHYRYRADSASYLISEKNLDVERKTLFSACNAVQLEREFICPSADVAQSLNAITVYHKRQTLVLLVAHGKTSYPEYKKFILDIRNHLGDYWKCDIGESTKARIGTLICCFNPRLYFALRKYRENLRMRRK